MKQYIQQLLSNCVNNLKDKGLLEADIQPKIIVDNTKDRSHGDFATNLAMQLSKAMKKNPRDVAALIIEQLPNDEKIQKIEIAGPGFINFYQNASNLGAQVKKLATEANLGIKNTDNPQTIVVDYSSPNVAKEMAVHHIRSTVIGDSVVRVLEFLGNKVIRANHIGDWGTQFGMLIAYLEKAEQENANDLILFYISEVPEEKESDVTGHDNGDSSRVVYAYVKGTEVRFRKSPSLEGAIIDSMQNGQQVQVLGVTGEWTHVAVQNEKGYIFSQFLTSEDPQAAAYEAKKAEEAARQALNAPAGDATDPATGAVGETVPDAGSPDAASTQSQAVPADTAAAAQVVPDGSVAVGG